jgi:NH3-dependent NAD+ synthetase
MLKALLKNKLLLAVLGTRNVCEYVDGFAVGSSIH